GNADQALDYYLRINPSAREDLGEIHRTEPYVYAQMIAGKDAPTHGEAKNSWLTGSAAWNYVAVTQWILGIRPEHDGLRVHPVVPASWDGFTVTRVFRGVTFLIRVRRTGPGGDVTVRCDDAAVDGDLVAVPTDRDQVTVEVEIG
ncbi:MAG: glycosyl transferase, partial [Acidimicrobiia bacterium]